MYLLQQPFEIVSLMIPILQKRKLRGKELKCLPKVTELKSNRTDSWSQRSGS